VTGASVLKFGGELLEEPSRLAAVVASVARVVRARQLIVIVHGGGKEIDAALKRAAIDKQQVDGLRITDAATLDVVVAVLAGAVNTRFVAALVKAGVPAVGLTGADDGCGLSSRAPLHRATDGRDVDLGHVGVPLARADVRLLHSLLSAGFVPVAASIGVDEAGELLNVNADTMAGHLAARLPARRLVIAGSTAGVLNESGATLDTIDAAGISALVSDGTATAGMIAKLRACEQALAAGVEDVVIVDGRDGAALEQAATGGVPKQATHIVAMAGRRT